MKAISNKVSRRNFLKVAGLAAAGAGLAACAPQTVTVVVTQEVEKQVEVTKEVTKEVQVTSQVETIITPTPGPVTFKMLVDGKPDGDFAKAHTAAITEYQQSHPNLTVNFDFQAIPDVQQVIPWLAAGTAPDAFRWSLDRGPQLGLKNMLYDWAPIATELGLVDKYIEAVWKGYMWRDGQVWSLPSDVNTFAMWYNPALFEEAGLKDKLPLKTWDDVLAAAEAIAKPNADPEKAIYGFGRPTTIAWAAWCHQWWVWREGGEFYDGKDLVFKDTMIESMTKLKSLIDKKLLPAFDNWQDTWYSGRLGMQEYGQWVIPGDVAGPWNDNKPQGTWKGSGERPVFVTSPLPSLKEGVPGYSILAGFGWFIPKTNRVPDETAKFLAWEVTNATHGQMYVTPYNQIPAVKPEVVTHEWLQTPTYAAFVEQLNTTKPMTVYPEINQFFDQVMPAPFIAAVTGKTPIAQAVEEMLQAGEPIIREAQAER